MLTRKTISIFLCVFWMIFIFYLSAEPRDRSDAKSYEMARVVYNSSEIVKSRFNLSKLNMIIRKNAHIFLYIVLAIFVLNVVFLLNLRGLNAIIYVLFICLLYAVLDEYHQLFVPGRGAEVKDVLIDFLGSLFGVGIYYVIYCTFYKKFFV